MSDIPGFIDYVTYDQDGNLLGGFIQALHPMHADAYIQVTPYYRQNWYNYRANRARTGLLLLENGYEDSYIIPPTPMYEPDEPPVDPEPEPPVQSEPPTNP